MTGLSPYSPLAAEVERAYRLHGPDCPPPCPGCLEVDLQTKAAVAAAAAHEADADLVHKYAAVSSQDCRPLFERIEAELRRRSAAAKGGR